MNIRRLPRYDLLGQLDHAVHDLGLRARSRLRSLAPARRPVERSEIEAPTPQILELFRVISYWTAVAAVLVGYHVLLGHAFGIGLLQSPGPGIPAMTPDEGLAALAAGAALYLLQKSRAAPAAGERVIAAGIERRVTQVCVVVVLLLALLALGASLGGQPGPRMAVGSAIAFLALGTGLLLSARGLAHRAVEVLGLGAAAIALQAIVGYLYHAPPFRGQAPAYTAVAVLLASVGLVVSRADRGFMAKVASNSLGGSMARRLLPAALVVPLVFGWLQERGQQAGLSGSERGLVDLSMANVIMFVIVVWWGVDSLYRMDTKRRQAERELKETAAKLRRSNADLEQFAYVTSHDLKEPLRAISGSVQVLQSRFGDRLGPEAEESIRHTVDGANRMQTLIDDLLTYSRLTTRDTALEPTSCEEVLEEALANLEVPVQEARAVVTHDPLPVVPADRTQLLQVFQNLLSNALKYRSERTPKIHVGAEARGDEWLFWVRDNGIGIAPQYADRIFKIFQRLHTRKDYPGTGIGLAVCKTVIERHGGRIWVESEPEEGSTFYFTLPS